jgi:hypothetical protein
MARLLAHRRLIVAATLGTILTGALGWWFLVRDPLRGLPDVGDPFDVETFSNRIVPDSQNAFQLYERAQQSYARNERARRQKIVDKWGRWQIPTLEPANWSAVTPGARAWLDANQKELELWRSATEQPAFQSHKLRGIALDAPLFVEGSFHTFARLALLDAARREAEGDMSGALDLYRALFRSSRHIGQNNGRLLRQSGVRLHRAACKALIRWAANPRADAALLRRALANASDDDALRVPASLTYQIEYLIYAALLDDRDAVARRMRHDLRYWREGPPLRRPNVASTQGYERLPLPERSAEWVKRLSTEVNWSTSREPERSRRILRLLIVNRLAHADDLPDRPMTTAQMSPMLYETTPMDPAAARVLPPAALARWYASSDLARIDPEAFNGAFEAALAGERAAQQNLLDVLNRELAKRHDQAAVGGRSWEQAGNKSSNSRPSLREGKFLRGAKADNNSRPAP